MENKKIMILLKIFAFIFFLWIHNPYNDLCNFDKYIDKECNAHRTFDIIFPRVLAKHIKEKQLYNTNLRQNLLNHAKGTKVKNLEEDRPIYSKIKMSESCNIDTYMKGYKRRYSKKRGLEKLDCYGEKILFDKFNYLHKIAENRKNCRTSFIEKILNRYGYRLILCSLIPIIGLIFPVIFRNKKEKLTSLSLFCAHENHEDTYKDCNAKKVPETILPYLEVFNYICIILFYFIIPTIYLSVIIYGFIKVVKYERIKLGKDKMSFMEYCRFCKDLFYLN